MLNEFMPRITVRVEAMKENIIHHMGIANSDMGEAVSKAVDKAVENYDLTTQVNTLVKDIINEAIARYFRLGPGCDIITDAVNTALDKVFKKPQETGEDE